MAEDGCEVAVLGVEGGFSAMVRGVLVAGGGAQRGGNWVGLVSLGGGRSDVSKNVQSL